MELSVVARTKTLDIITVGEPVGTADIAFGCHIVAVLVDINDLTDLLIERILSGIGGQLTGIGNP